ncbi:LarC family nickel insertion protein [Microaerobacter geothermalis]|uniref:nickel insertion protein n=1 Tax=Microaerobacter geothermalis TaxID=674972 RepID=UPI001F1A8F77|nr:nickel insertion protein [Microaerobacter geothermalis]MCF6092402.1 LarC family nickel insertion protein [Microaerobacter geothermalis]
MNHYCEHDDHEMMKIEVNLDDMNPEWLGIVMEKLFCAGANDVYYSSIYMKKSRPAVLLHILVHRDKLEKMMEIVFEETTTFGLRYYPVSCYRLGRSWITVDTKWGEPVRIKIGIFREKTVQFSPEYEDCAKIAREKGIPLKEVYREALRLAESENCP